MEMTAVVYLVDGGSKSVLIDTSTEVTWLSRIVEEANSRIHYP